MPDVKTPSFCKVGQPKTQEEINKDNRSAKENKKDVKQIMRTNKDAIEDMDKNNQANAQRLEGQISKIGDNITQSNKKLHQTIITLTGAIQTFMTSTSGTAPPPHQNTDTDEPATQTERIETSDAHKKSTIQRQQEQDQNGSPASGNRHQEPSQENCPQLSIPNAQNKFRTQETQDSQDSQPEQQPNQYVKTSQQESDKINQEQEQRIQLLESRMKLLEEEFDKHKTSQEHTESTQEHKSELPEKEVIPKTKKKQVLLHTPSIDMEGNPIEDKDSNRLENQPIDWTVVKFPKRHYIPRPSLTDTMDEKVTEDLEKHIEDKYRGDNVPKLNPQKMMRADQRQELIRKMLDNAGYKLGIAPLTTDHMERVQKLLAAKGVFNKEDTQSMRKQKTVKALIKSWAMKNLQMSEEDWKQGPKPKKEFSLTTATLYSLDVRQRKM